MKFLYAPQKSHEFSLHDAWESLILYNPVKAKEKYEEQSLFLSWFFA